MTSRDVVKEGEEPTWVKRRITEVEDEQESSTASPIRPTRAVVLKTSAAPSLLSITPDIPPLACPPLPAAPTLTWSSSSLASFSPELVVQMLPILKTKATERIEGVVKRTKMVKIPVIYLEVYEKLQQIEEKAEKDTDNSELRDITCVQKGLMWIEEADREQNSMELWEAG